MTNIARIEYERSTPSKANDLFAPHVGDLNRSRYRCAHLLWDAAGGTALTPHGAIAAMARQVATGSARLERLDLICGRLAALQPPVIGYSTQLATEWTHWSIQVHSHALGAVFEMQWLFQHSAWQLLIQSENHVALTCLRASEQISTALRAHVALCNELPVATRSPELLSSALELVRENHLHWVRLLQESQRWGNKSYQEVLLRLSMLRSMHRAVALPVDTRGPVNSGMSKPATGGAIRMNDLSMGSRTEFCMASSPEDTALRDPQVSHSPTWMTHRFVSTFATQLTSLLGHRAAQRKPVSIQQ